MHRGEVLRWRGEGGRARVTNVELFFDLVYVFAFIQLSDHLFADLHYHNAVETVILFLATWWGWVYAAWACNWVNPESRGVTAWIGALMTISLGMSAAIPDAFKDRGEDFAVSYVGLLVLINGFMLWVFGLKQQMGRNYLQVLIWTGVAGVLWITGGFVHVEDTRIAIWGVAVAIDLVAPLFGFWVPGLGTTRRWTLAGGHFAERSHLVLMVAFGESVLRIGDALTHAHNEPLVDLAFVIGFLLVFGLWAIFFLHHAEFAADELEHETEPDEAVKIARSVYIYAGAVMVGALIVIAVAVHFAIYKPTAPVSVAFAAICLGGPALYLLGIAISKRWVDHTRALPSLLGIVALVVLGVPAAFGSRITELLAAAIVAVGLWIYSQYEQSASSAANAS